MPNRPSQGPSRRGLIFSAGSLALFATSALAGEAHKKSAGKAAIPGNTAAPAAHGASAHEAPGVDPETALQRLLAGNQRHASGYPAHPNDDAARRTETAAGQHPFATILTCADSRLSPELIFDQGLGDLFVVRVAGNVVDDAVLASIEYSVIHLGSTLIMALGHERCGAVKATMEALDGHPNPEDADTRLAALANLIAPAVKATPADAPDRLDAAVTLNASRAAAEIFAGSPPLRQRVLAGKLKIVSARYDLDDGRVTPTKAETDAPKA